MEDDWASYDAVAATYARVSAPRYFAGPARHLVSLLEPAQGERLLDVGCGTGAVAAAMTASLGGAETVAGSDASVTMLVEARGTAGSLAAAELPDLPWHTGAFDAVAAGFVLNHVPDARGALLEIRRVLRPGGRLGASTWERSPSETEAGEVWRRVAYRFVEPEALQAAVDRALPHADRFSEPARLAKRVSDAGFVVEHADVVAFPVTLPTSDFADSRLLAIASRFLRSVLGPAEWSLFSRTARDALLRTFGPELALDTRVIFVIGS